jgi:hypothetical protein
MNYGAITQVDADVLESILALYKNRRLKFLEIGVWNGQTSRGIKDYCQRNNIALDYWGIDPNASADFAGKLITGVSEEVWGQTPSDFDVVFVDGCHCIAHVILDAIIYGAKIVPLGFMLFHDTAPKIQHVQTNHWVHGRGYKPIHLTAVRDAFKLLRWPSPEWELWAEDYDPTSDIGGMMVFRKHV